MARLFFGVTAAVLYIQLVSELLGIHISALERKVKRFMSPVP